MKKNGFTLMEIIVVLGIFVTVVLSISAVIINSGKAQRKTAFTQKVQSEARFALEAIAREARMGRIDYTYAYNGDIGEDGQNGILNDEIELVLRDADNNQTIFKKSNVSCPLGASNCLLVSSDGGASFNPLTSTEVQNLKFYISPSIDPFSLNLNTGEYGPNVQPRVTIVLTLKGGGAKPEEQAVVFLQTTVTSRMYLR